MINTILLEKNMARVKELTPCLLPDNLFLKFESNYCLDNAFITIKNGNVLRQYKVVQGLKVDDDLLIGGNLEMTIKAYNGREIVKEWAVLPLKLIETDKGIISTDFLADLESQIAEIEQQGAKALNDLKAQINKLVTSHNELVDTVKAIKENY